MLETAPVSTFELVTLWRPIWTRFAIYSEQQRFKKITILLFLMSSQQGDFIVFQHAFLAPIQGIKNSKIVIFCKRYCSLINRET